MSGIAERVYGDMNMTDELHNVNLATIGRDASLLRVGDRLDLPCLQDIEAEHVSSRPLDLPQEGVRTSRSLNGTLRPFDQRMGRDGFQSVPRSTMPLEPRIAAEDLLERSNRNGLQIIDLRRGDELADAGYVPGSVAISFNDLRAGGDSPGAPASDADLSRVLSAAGLYVERPTVLVHAADHPMHFARAAYAYWLLKSSGFTELSILDGGAAAWIAADHPTQAEPITPQATRLSVTVADTWRASPLEVAAIASGQSEGVLLDGRPRGFFRRESGGVVVPSTLHGAQNLESLNLHATGQEDGSGIDILDQLKSANVDWDEIPVVNFCTDGTLSAVNWFYASEIAGISQVKLYPESIRGWVGDGNPIEIGTLGERLSR